MADADLPSCCTDISSATPAALPGARKAGRSQSGRIRRPRSEHGHGGIHQPAPAVQHDRPELDGFVSVNDNATTVFDLALTSA